MHGTRTQDRAKKLASNIINSHQDPVQVKPATLLIPIYLCLFPDGGGVYGTRCQSGSFFLIDGESGFHCLR